MKSLGPIFFSCAILLGLLLLIGKKFNLSQKYHRKPHTFTPWSALDSGIDPTISDEEKL